MFFNRENLFISYNLIYHEGLKFMQQYHKNRVGVEVTKKIKILKITAHIA